MSLTKRYKVNEIFYSLQGEGVRAGTANIFVRFSGCNLECRRETEGFDCDTEFTSGVFMTKEDIINRARQLSPNTSWIIMTGGEPTLQVDDALVRYFRNEGYHLAIETNGTREVHPDIEWICVSPKTAEHTLRQKSANEVKYVRRYGQGIPQTSVKADHYLLSPAFDSEVLPQENLNWCIQLCKEHPQWRLSVQNHKIWKVA